jgi:hypothetical protein
MIRTALLPSDCSDKGQSINNYFSNKRNFMCNFLPDRAEKNIGYTVHKKGIRMYYRRVLPYQRKGVYTAVCSGSTKTHFDAKTMKNRSSSCCSKHHKQEFTLVHMYLTFCDPTRLTVWQSATRLHRYAVIATVSLVRTPTETIVLYTPTT